MSYHYSSSHSNRTKSRYYLLFIAFIILIMVFSASGYYFRGKLLPLFSSIGDESVKVKSWFLSHKKNILPLSKETKDSVDKEKPVHFEFYSALPEMAIDVPKKDKEQDESGNKDIKQTMQPFAFSQDQLVKEFAEKLDESKEIEEIEEIT